MSDQERHEDITDEAPPSTPQLSVVPDVDAAPPLEEPTTPVLGEPPGAWPIDDPGVVALHRPETTTAELPPALATAERLPSLLESLILVSDRPLQPQDLARLTGEEDTARIEAVLEELSQRYAGRGIQLHPVAGGWQFRTDPQNAPWVSRLLAQKPVRLTRAQLETLAIIAYRQPITRPEIDDIRGVDSGATLKLLLDRSLIRILGKKEEPGRPLLYGTTREFLEFFNLSDLRSLPTLREFQELSDEHQAQVASLGGPAASRITVAPEPPPPPLSLTPEAVDLAPLEDDDLTDVEQMIEDASRSAQRAAKAVVHEIHPAEPAAPSPDDVAGPPLDETGTAPTASDAPPEPEL